MNIILDGMGSDNHPIPEVAGILQAAKEYPDDNFILVGNSTLIHPLLSKANAEDLIKVFHADQVLEMDDKPARSARKKADNSMAIGMDLLKSGEGDVFVTAGNTGGALANGLFRLGRIRGVKRPALTGLFPTAKGHVVLADLGANADCKPIYLLQFALMGSIYAEKVLHIDSPKVGILSNGEEEGKGNQITIKSAELLKSSSVNFVGNIEPKELFAGEADVVVTDGFTGNILLKTSEAVSGLMMKTLRDELGKNIFTMFGALLAKSSFKQVKTKLDPSEIGAVPLLGLNGLVFIGHGRSDQRGIFNAILSARTAVENELLDSLRESTSTMLGKPKQ